MLTLVQWKQTRRVDHLDIIGFHPRFRDGGPHNDLKFFDALVNRFWAACNALNVDRDLDVVYLEEYDQDDVQGRTFRLGVNQYGETPNKPIVTVRRLVAAGGNPATHPTTLAHEIGHALTSYPDHSTDANNLMASGAIRNGLNRLSDGQIGWFRRNAVLT